MDFWRETAMVAPDGGMCKDATPGVKQSRASQWRARARRHFGASVDMAHCDYAWTCDIFIPQKAISYMFMVIDDST